nr:hypothetical protein [Tanacetum cinerariifolium]
MIDQGVTIALAARDTLRSTNGDDSHNSGTGVRRTERATRECTYTDFLKCQPLPFKGTEGVASLSQWCERMESIFNISNCAVKNQVKFATCTLHSVALTWWNTHVKGTDLESYTQRYQELALLCKRMFSEESDKIEKYVGGLPDMIHRCVVASKPKTMQEAIEITTELMDKNIRTFAECETASKRKNMANTNNANNQRGTRLGQKTTCYECGVQGHFRRECPKLKNNNNHGNQGGRNNASVRVYAVGRAGANPDANLIVMANRNPRHLLDYDEEEDPEMEIEEEEPEEEPVEEPEPLPGHGDQFDAHPNPQPGNMNGWVDDDDDVEEEDDEENEDADMEEHDDAEIIFPYEVQSDQTPPPRDEIMPPKQMSEARMREIIHDQFATSMNEFMANMNSGAGGPGGASGSDY